MTTPDQMDQKKIFSAFIKPEPISPNKFYGKGVTSPRLSAELEVLLPPKAEKPTSNKNNETDIKFFAASSVRPTHPMNAAYNSDQSRRVHRKSDELPERFFQDFASAICFDK